MLKKQIKDNFIGLEARTYYGRISYYASYKTKENDKELVATIKIDGNEIHKVLANKIRKGEFEILKNKDNRVATRLVFID